MQILIIRLALAAILIFCFYFSEYIYACKLEKMKEKKKKSSEHYKSCVEMWHPWVAHVCAASFPHS